MTWRDDKPEPGYLWLSIFIMGMAIMVVLIALAVYGCRPALVNMPACPACEPPAVAPAVALPTFPTLPKITHKDTAALGETCYDAENFALLQRRVSLILCDDCTLRRRAAATLPAECDAHPECQ